jgi:hypothetical protein
LESQRAVSRRSSSGTSLTHFIITRNTVIMFESLIGVLLITVLLLAGIAIVGAILFGNGDQSK